MLHFIALAESGNTGAKAGRGGGIASVSGPGGKRLANSTATRKAAQERRANQPASRTQLRTRGNSARRRG